MLLLLVGRGFCFLLLRKLWLELWDWVDILLLYECLVLGIGLF